MLGDPVTDLTVAMEVNYFRQAKDRYFVPVSVKIPGSDIELARKSGAESTRLDFIGEIRDAKGAMAGTVRDDIAVKLKGEDQGQLAKRNLEYDTGFTLEPGTYSSSSWRGKTKPARWARSRLSSRCPILPPSQTVTHQFRRAGLPARERWTRPWPAPRRTRS